MDENESEQLPPEPGTVPDTELGVKDVIADLEPPANDQELGDAEPVETEEDEDGEA